MMTHREKGITFALPNRWKEALTTRVQYNSKGYAMKTKFIFMVLIMIAVGCQRSADDMWNDTKTASRHVGRGMNSLGGKGGTSRQIANREDFGTRQRPKYDDVIAMNDVEEELQVGESEQLIPPPDESPGDEGSSIPGIEAFHDPALDPSTANIFEHIHFPYNSGLIKTEKDLRIIEGIATYLRQHTKTYIFIEGHCDKRGSAAYNFALGANRANAVRALLIKEGVNPNQLFTISYGKERLLFEENGEEFHRLNRRSQCKIYEK